MSDIIMSNYCRTLLLNGVMLLFGGMDVVRGATVISLRPDGTGTGNGDAFVTTGSATTDLSGNNYGGAGSIGVSAALANGSFASLLRFDVSTAKASLDGTYGVGGWTIDSIGLQLTTTNANNGIFNANHTGTFDVSLISSTTWVEGTGNPNIPTTTGVKWTEFAGLTSGAEALGAFSIASVTDGTTATYTLTPTSSLLYDVLNGGVASLALTADSADNAVSAQFNSRNFTGTASRRPALIITASATPEPGRALLLMAGAVCVAWRRRKPITL